MSPNLWESFLYNMIALEILLVGGGGKTETILVDRLTTLFGWLTNEKKAKWENLISRLYKLRCKFVHNGMLQDITINDLLDSDMLLANVLYNLCALSNTIKSKSDLIELSKKIDARRVLGMKMIDRPKAIKFRTQAYTKKDLEQLENSKHWSW